MGWVEIFELLAGWVGSTIEKILQLRNGYVNAFKAQLDKIWLHQAVKFISCIGLGRAGSKLFPLLVGWVGSGHTKWTHG